MKSTCCFTISTPSHFILSTVFFESALKHSVSIAPESYIFLFGSNEKYRPLNIDKIKIIDVESIVSPVLVKWLLKRYTPSECCWALKPVIFQWLIEQFDRVFYFDSDILITGPLEEIMDEIENYSILLTPHYLSPFGSTSKTGIRALSLLRGGIFNAGFVGVRQTNQARSFLSWWSDHVSKHGRNDPDNGMCGDQRWLDLVPVLYPETRVSRHPGMNVGYWNIHERLIEGSIKQPFCNGQGLLFLHFSGFTPDHPFLFSKHLPLFEAKGILAEFCSYYAYLLSNAPKLLPLSGERFYAHRRWWHRCVKQYRFIVDLFLHPRS